MNKMIKMKESRLCLVIVKRQNMHDLPGGYLHVAMPRAKFVFYCLWIKFAIPHPVHFMTDS